MRRSVVAVFGSALFLGLALPAVAQTSIDTYDGGTAHHWGFAGDFNYGSNVDGYGSGPDRLVYSTGQTFRATAGSTRLDSFSFFVSAYGSYHNPGLAVFRGFIFEWDNVLMRAVGPVLFESSSTSGTTTSVLGTDLDWERRSFATGGLDLDPTRTYVALISGIADISSAPVHEYALNSVARVESDVYAGGFAVHTSSYYITPSGSTGATLTDDNQPESTNYEYYSSYDAAFEAQFSSTTVTPEPLSMALLGTGLAGVAAARRRRKREEESA